ncbi:efflux RND transporter periplasmic adaptor subunit [Roseimarinus sediminis]|uniref:efflux RND transporter periplasmic adaptor subunit n=1 Tax=Roseimarinus sediminis TaxID=1610899 RepID=UPI003D19BFF8
MKRIIITSAIALFLMACGQEAAKETASTEAASPAERIYPVKVQTLELSEIDKVIEYPANLEPFEQLYFAPASPGKIKKIHVEVGDRVKKGQLLVSMDETQLIQAKIQLESLKTDFERMKKLLETNSIAQQQFDQIKTQYEVTKSNIEFLEENTILEAPFDGIITAKYFENGEIYSGAPNTQAGKAAIVTLEQISFLKATLNVSEQYFNLLNDGDEVSITTNVYPGEVFPGTIMNIFPTIDPLSRSFSIEVKIPNRDQRLRPGMFTRVSMITQSAETIVVPAITVMQQEGTNKRYIFINKNGVAKRINITIGRRFDDRFEIISDEIEAGDQLIVAGQAVLMDNDKVEVKN